MAALRTGGLWRKVTRLEQQSQTRRTGRPILDRLTTDPAQLLVIGGTTPDPWQEQLMRSDSTRMLLLCSRQAGKSTIAAALALREALTRPRSLVLILSRAMRQSGELFRKILDHFNALGRPMAVSAESALRMELINGSRIISLPGDEETIRGFSGVTMLIIDEAARVADALYYSVRPMLAVSHGRLVALSTPFGKRGWFHDAWYSNEPWERVKITADQCPRIDSAFLAEERRALGERWYRQEYECDFCSLVDAVFAYEDIQAALSDDVTPLLLG